MAYDYPVMYGVGGEGTAVKFVLCTWDTVEAREGEYHAIYCPVCEKRMTAKKWPKLIKHENKHLKKMGCDESGRGAKRKKVMKLKKKANRFVQSLVKESLDKE